MNKKLFILAVTLLSVLSIKAQEAKKSKDYDQTKKGNYFISGSANLSFRSLKNDFSPRYIGLDFTGGRFIANNLALGVGVNSIYSWSEGQSVGGIKQYSKSYNFRLAALGRKYFGRRNFRPFIEAGIGVEFDGIDFQIFDNDSFNKGSDNSIYLIPHLNIGASYFINDYISLDFELNPLQTSSNFSSHKIGLSVFF